MIEEFKVEFVHWEEQSPGEKPLICDFCEERPVVWYCDFLVTGYCEQCMIAQKLDYAERERRLDE